MHTGDLLRTMAEDLGSQPLAKRALLALIRALLVGLGRGQDVRIHEFGRFRCKVVKGRRYRKLNGEEGELPAYCQVTFSMAPRFRDSLREGRRVALEEGS